MRTPSGSLQVSCCGYDVVMLGFMHTPSNKVSRYVFISCLCNYKVYVKETYKTKAESIPLDVPFLHRVSILILYIVPSQRVSILILYIVLSQRVSILILYIVLSQRVSILNTLYCSFTESIHTSPIYQLLFQY